MAEDCGLGPVLGASSLNLAEVAEAIMKKVILFASCMLVLGSGSAMAGALATGINTYTGYWSQGFTIHEGSSQYFDVLSVTDPSTGSFYYVSGSINALSGFGDGYGHNAGWSETGTEGTIAFTGGNPPNTEQTLTYTTTAVDFSLTFVGVPDTALTFHINLFDDPDDSPSADQIAAYATSAAPIDSYYVTYDPSSSTPWTFEESNPAAVPEPSLVLLLGIGLGAVGLMVWRRGV